jgi:hypothetical protein
MMRHLIFVALLSGSVSAMWTVGAGFCANKATIPAGAQVYIDRLEAGFERDIRAELERQKVPLQIVSSEDQAHFVMGNSSEDWQVNSYNPKDERRAASQLVGKLKKIVRQVR